jgi:hypothetical protein
MPNPRDPLVENSLQQLEVQALNFGYRFIVNSRVRTWCIQTTQPTWGEPRPRR